jgi:hypothetical protein
MLVANSAQAAVNRTPHVMGVCNLLELDEEGVAQRQIGAVGDANTYFKTQDEKIDYATAKISVVQQPQHGKLMARNTDGDLTVDLDDDWRQSFYFPDVNYRGNDSLGMRVEGNGYSVELHYFFTVSSAGEGDSLASNSNCKGVRWRISSTVPQILGGRDLFALNSIPFGGYQLKLLDLRLNSTADALL